MVLFYCNILTNHVREYARVCGEILLKQRENFKIKILTEKKIC